MRVFLTGPTGSGKSTLSRQIASLLEAPLYSLDDIHWVRDAAGDYRRAPAERLALLESVAQQDAWVIEGVQFKWADIAIERADCVLVLDLPRLINLSRIARRFLGRRLAPLRDRRGTIAALREELRWSNDYYRTERRMLFAKLEPWTAKVILAGSSDEALRTVGLQQI
jgi:adenylate kinase family enzyme